MFDSHWGVHLSKAPWPPTGSRAAAIAASRSSTAAALGCVSPRTARNTTSGELALSKRERRLSRATCSTLFCCAAAMPSRPRARSSGMWIVIVPSGTILSTPGALRQAAGVSSRFWETTNGERILRGQTLSSQSYNCSMSADRDRLQSLVDALPDTEVQVAISFLAELGEQEIGVDGDTTDPIPSFQVRLNPWAQGFNLGPPHPVKTDPSNNFSFDDVNPEHFEINVNPLPGSLYLKSIRAGNADVLANGLDLTAGGGASLDIVIGVNAPQITGTVQDPATQQPALAVTVVLIPQEKERREVSLYYRTASTDQNGNFTMGRVNPGEYKVYAWEEVENGAWFDPDFLKPIESKGAAVSVREGSPVSVQLTVIPAGSGN